MEAINKSLINVSKVKELIKTFLEFREVEKDNLSKISVELLTLSSDLLEKTEEILANSHTQ